MTKLALSALTVIFAISTAASAADSKAPAAAAAAQPAAAEQAAAVKKADADMPATKVHKKVRKHAKRKG